jgi:hypothetical protein
MKVLLHICCAPCCLAAFRDLAERGHSATGYFYNPNIHPLIEFRRRLKALKVLQERLPVPVICEEQYGLKEYLSRVCWSGEARERCADCYRLRLERTAHEAAHRGFGAFTTTLLGSTHQDHDLVRQVGEEACARHGVGFCYADWRPAAGQAHEQARGMGLYMQNYCGCVFSEWERFRDTGQHLYRGCGPLSRADENPDAGA